MTEHEDFELLCTLAATGQISEGDKQALATHCEHCSGCHHLLLELIQIDEELLLNLKGTPETCKLPSGMQQRFTKRAEEEGLFLKKAWPVLVLQSHWFGVSLTAAVVLLLLSFPRFREPAELHDVHTINQAAVAGAHREMKATKSLSGHTQAFRHARSKKHFPGVVRPAGLVETSESIPSAQRPCFYFPSLAGQHYSDNSIPYETPSGASLLAVLADIRNLSDASTFRSDRPLPPRFIDFASPLQPAKRVFRYEAGIASLNLAELLSLKKSLPPGLKPGIRPLQFQKPTEE